MNEFSDITSRLFTVSSLRKEVEKEKREQKQKKRGRY